MLADNLSVPSIIIYLVFFLFSIFVLLYFLIKFSSFYGFNY